MEKASSELAGLEFSPLWATCLDHRAGRDPQNPMLPPFISKEEQRPELRTDLLEPTALVEGPGLVLSPATQPALFICSKVCFSDGTACSDPGTFMRWAKKSQKKWIALGAKGWGSQGGRQVSSQVWGRILACSLLSFSLLSLGTKGTPVGFPALVS